MYVKQRRRPLRGDLRVPDCISEAMIIIVKHDYEIEIWD